MGGRAHHDDELPADDALSGMAALLIRPMSLSPPIKAHHACLLTGVESCSRPAVSSRQDHPDGRPFAVSMIGCHVRQTKFTSGISENDLTLQGHFRRYW
ncbi:hypothetical protein E2C01_044497 [Portunus trituberculatus]|uniref:Uncharacterized protein n=1 Tax=Portunus trituberculatus TaxID=210409 RepID=A0A5B7G0L9_PORTR|nr:hypothetical protein [Portunus trituberculatus]